VQGAEGNRAQDEEVEGAGKELRLVGHPFS
jgi:hypothetical protein